MKTALTSEIDVDELMASGVFQGHDSVDVALISLGGSLRFKATKPESLTKFAAAISAAAITLAVAQKTAETLKRAETT